jgi:hypothetical protein
MKSAAMVVTLLLVAACASASDEQAEELGSFLPGATVISGDPICDDCSIDMALLTHLAEARDKDALTGDFRSLLVTPQGIIVTSETPGPPLLFGMDGRLIRPLEGNARVPDIYRKASAMARGRGDSIYIVDEMAKQLVVLGPYLNAVRTVPLSDSVRGIVGLPRGDVLVVSPSTSGGITHPLLWLPAAGESLLPFDNFSVDSPSEAAPLYSSRVVASARDGEHFWVAHPLRYAIEKRTLDGELVQLIERDVHWFPPSMTLAPENAESQPTARVTGIWEDGRGLLWVQTSTADGRWPSALGSLTGVDGVTRYFVESRDLYRDTRIEIIDPFSGSLVATEKFDTELPTFSPGPFLSRVVVGPTGWPVGEVYSLHLSGFNQVR